MTDVLASLGLTQPKADPSLYENQKEVTAQLDAAKKELKSTVDSADLALKTAALVGFKNEITDRIQTQVDDTKALLNQADVSPEKLEKKRAEIEGSLAAFQDSQKKALEENAAKDARAALDTIQLRVEAVRADTNTSAELLARFEELLAKAKKSADEVAAKGAAATTSPDYVPANVLLGELDGLNFDKEDEEAKDFSLKRFFQRLMRRMATAFLVITVVVGGILGGSIVSNQFAGEPFIGVKAFYFFYGAVFFPFSLLFGCIFPPNWYATIAPLTKRMAPQPSGIIERLFSYADLTAEEAAEYRPAEKTTLRVLSIVTTLFLVVLGWYYDLIGYLKRGG